MIASILDPHNLTLLVTALITGIISPILIHYVRFIFIKNVKKIKTCDVAKNLKNEESITNKLLEILNRYEGDRVWIFEFHNGGHTFTGKSLQKFSQTYEVAKKGISKEGPNTQNLPTSLFSTFFNQLATQFEYHTSNINEDMEVTNCMRSFLEGRGVKSMITVVVKNIENKMIGVLGVDFVLEREKFSKEDITDLKSVANNIAGYLDYMSQMS